MNQPSSHRRLRLTAYAVLTLIVLFLLFVCALSTLILPAPTGSLPIATAVFHLRDDSRIETARNDGTKRELVVQAWYPAAHRYGLPAPYRRWAETTSKSAFESLLFTHSLAHSPLSAAQPSYPVLLLNPAWNSLRTGWTFLAEDLASHGYIVLAIDHPYNAGIVQLADGSIAFASNANLDLGALGVEGAYARIDAETRLQAQDTLFVRRQLDLWNSDPANPFYRHLDLGKIGAIGHSLGGAVSAEAAIHDPAIRAVFSMSGPLFADARKTGVAVPFFYLSEKLLMPDDATLAQMPPGPKVDSEMDRLDMANLFTMLAQHGGIYLQLPTGDHSIFSDAPLFIFSQRIHSSSRRSIDQQQSAIRQYALAFFNLTLRGQPSPLLSDSAHPLAGGTMRIFPPAPWLPISTPR